MDNGQGKPKCIAILSVSGYSNTLSYTQKKGRHVNPGDGAKGVLRTEFRVKEPLMPRVGELIVIM